MIKELSVMIKCNGIWHSMQPHNLINNSFPIEDVSAVLENLTTITNIESIPHSVQGKPNMKFIERSSHIALGMGLYLTLLSLTYIEPRHNSSNIPSQSRLIVPIIHSFNGFISSMMTR